MKTTDAAWAAGLFDGEGSVWYTFNAKKGQTLNCALHLRMTCPLAVGKWAELFEGEGINVVRYESVLSSGKVLYGAQVGGITNFPVATRLLRPYLTTKAVQVDAVNAAIASITRHPLRSQARRDAHRHAYERVRAEMGRR